ncbi:MAG TPA: glycoside hydrolase family 13 protein [Lentimicrobium sp.]|nr:glycoside hydrolase family 13 protein [Lentimicrobium sp.]
MKKVSLSFLFLFALSFISCKTEEKTLTTQGPPQWSKNVIWYQIFVERFNNGDRSNDPTIESISTPTASFPVPEDWSVTPWTSDWYTQEPWAVKTGLKLRETLQHRRYGGDLKGIFDKLDYLTGLGITAIYLNPVNDSPSLHKYDARNYHHIDINFGPDPKGDLAILASENPADPSTWKWTAADKMFLQLVDELHKRGIKVIVDYSWNHTGVLFWAFQDLIKNQQKSAYKDWYEVLSFDDPNTHTDEFNYKGWVNIRSLPEIKKIDIKGERISGHPYEGNINEGAKKHIFDVTKRWLAPDGDVSKGIDGFRLDVAEQVPMGFWRDYRQLVKSVNPEAYLVGEIWWEKWPDTFMDPGPYANPEIFDAVMYYQAYRPARGFFAEGEPVADAKEFSEILTREWNLLAEPFRYSMMNVNATHDSPRLLSDFANKGKYKYRAHPYDDSTYITGKPEKEVYERVKLYLVHQYTSIGSPHIWNGDEFGMWGGDDPDERKPLWWQEYKFDPETRTNIKSGKKEYDSVGFNTEVYDYYRKLIEIRKNNPVFSDGKFEFITAEGKSLIYKRQNTADLIYVVFNLNKDKPNNHNIGKGQYIDLLSGKEFNGEDVMIEPFSALILKKTD